MPPTPSDLAAATRFVDDEYRLEVCPVYFANHRERLIRQVAVAEMQKRMAAERRASIADAGKAGRRAAA